MSTLQRNGRTVRALAAGDLAEVVAIDEALSGRARRAYFERRLAWAQRDSERYLQLAVEQDGSLAGFILGRALEGEFGRSEPELRLEALGVKTAAQGRGLGAALSEAFETAARRRGLAQIRTAALWRQHALLRFLDRAGYRLAPMHVLDRETTADYEPLSRDAGAVELLRQSDAEGVARIDRRLTGRDRRGYLCRAIEEALGESSVRISLIARIDEAVAGFLMARMDYGDFGRAEPVAVLDTLGVDPLRARQGIGRELLSQLLVNLRGLGVERVETVVEPGSLALMGFFHHAGFRPAQRLAFLKTL